MINKYRKKKPKRLNDTQNQRKPSDNKRIFIIKYKGQKPKLDYDKIKKQKKSEIRARIGKMD